MQASITYYGLHSLQHRGQEASGIAVSDGENITLQKGKGLTVDVFQREKLDSMVGRLVVGHVRYSTRAVRKMKTFTNCIKGT